MGQLLQDWSFSASVHGPADWPLPTGRESRPRAREAIAGPAARPGAMFPQDSPLRSAMAPAPRMSAPQACWCSASSRAARTPVAARSWRCWATSCPCARPTTTSCRRMATGAATSVVRGRQRQTLRLRRKWSGTSPGSSPRLGTGWSAASLRGWWLAWPHSSVTRACRRRRRCLAAALQQLTRLYPADVDREKTLLLLTLLVAKKVADHSPAVLQDVFHTTVTFINQNLLAYVRNLVQNEMD
ncbi:BH3-interacting domain death agonist isoform X3 [Phocoena sinus]|uniref:BH3-interacting domain death agonist isoform X3 n=1 Tax=Phocoena sinus TaxID=42100 RepID=UPI0013C4FAF6|nr:BH3-interacting domain death agonist isoform X3 [Phocoena sinus]